MEVRKRVLNLGAGESATGDVRFDISRHGRPDVQGTAAELPFTANAFDQVVADQVLEHLSSEQVIATLNEVHRVLRPGGRFEIYVPHADSRLSQQDPTHRSTWTYRTVDYFTDGNFAWYFENEPFEFTLAEREVNVWVHPERPFSGIRSKEIQLRHRLFGTEDEYAFESDVDASLRFILQKPPEK
ncbi:methyltransferase domain-containing protein [Haloarcula rara]|uniref:methyltransferase domain-containing protein n=1 Tax=Haloarcula rara TaxID=3033387 RepID=UPI0023E7ADEB|nr:methyltransferase domain-containing protein [Halomicroarcula sp. SHR3]